METQKESMPLSNFTGLQTTVEGGLLTYGNGSSVTCSESSGFIFEDGTITSCPGTSKFKVNDVEVDFDINAGIGVIGEVNYNAFNGAYPVLRNEPSTNVKLSFSRNGSVSLFSPNHNAFFKFTDAFTIADNCRWLSWAVYDHFESTDSADWSLLFVGTARNSPFMWNSKFDYVKSVASGSIVIDMSHSTQFSSVNKKLTINGYDYSYTSYSDSTGAFSGVTADSGSPVETGIAVGSLVIQTPESITGSTRYTALNNVSTNGVLGEPNIFCKYKGRLAIGSNEKTNIALSEISNPLNFVIPVSPTAASAIHIKNIDGEGSTRAMAVVKDYLVLLKENAIIPIRVRVDGEWTVTDMKALTMKRGVGPKNQKAVYSFDNSLVFMSSNNELTYVSQELDGSDFPSLRQVSDDVYNTLQNHYFDNCRVQSKGRNIMFTGSTTNDVDSNDVLFSYDRIKKSFTKLPMAFDEITFDADDGLVYGWKTNDLNRQLINDYSTNDFDDITMSRKWVSQRINLGSEYKRKTLYEVWIRGQMSKADEFKVKFYMNYTGNLKEFEVTVKGDGTSNTSHDYIIGEATSSSYGSKVYGESVYGTSDTVSDLMQEFIVNIPMSLDVQPYDMLVEVTDESHGKLKIFSITPTYRTVESKIQGTIIGLTN